MGKSRKPVLKQKKNKGQSTVEYIMLLAVITSIVVSVVNSDWFKQFFGPDSEVFERMKSYMEYTYRHGLPGQNGVADYGYGQEHETYFKDGQTRFFYPKDRYP